MAVGIEEAQAVGKHLQKSGAKPELALSSSAVRALQTFEHVAQAFPDEIACDPERSLYVTAAGGMLQAIHSTSPEISQLLMVGHVPAIEELAIALCGRGSPQHRLAMESGFPPGALATLGFNTDEWTSVSLRGGEIKDFITPAQLTKP
jgi:phosphohistidine phosphatase